jgi:hypothetical protein
MRRPFRAATAVILTDRDDPVGSGSFGKGDMPGMPTSSEILLDSITAIL